MVASCLQKEARTQSNTEMVMSFLGFFPPLQSLQA